MPLKRLILVALLVLAGAAPKKEKAAETPPKVPARLEAFVELSQQCAQYEKLVTVTRWREVWRSNFDAAGSEKWVTPAGEAPPADPNVPVRLTGGKVVAPTVTAERVDNRDCAVLDASDMQNAYFALPCAPVRGEFAIEFVGKAMSERPCDLSIATMAAGQLGPGFEFGAHYNSANFLRVVNPQGGVDRTNIPQTPLIEKDHWYTVRVEVRNGKVTGSLDGKAIASLPTKIEPDKAYAPQIYLFQSKVAIDQARVETMAPSASETTPEAAFTKVFGSRPRDEVMGQVARLVELMADGDPKVREAAHQLLKPMGTITRDALRAAIETGPEEQASRAQQLLDLMAPPTTRPAK